MTQQLGYEGKALIKAFESLRLDAYQDEKGIWTIGWGHTGPEVQPGTKITEAIAEKLFEMDTASAVADVSRLVTSYLSSCQFDALVSFVYNLGARHFADSTMLRLLNAGNADGAKDQFKRWVKAGPNVSRGLINRRAAEEHLFCGRYAEWRQVVKICLGKTIGWESAVSSDPADNISYAK